MLSFRQWVITLACAVSLCVVSFSFIQAEPGCPLAHATATSADVVYVYMIHDSEADDPKRSWLGLDALGLVYWTTQERAWVTTRRAEAEDKRATLLSKRGRRSVIRKFFLMESLKK